MQGAQRETKPTAAVFHRPVGERSSVPGHFMSLVPKMED